MSNIIDFKELKTRIKIASKKSFENIESKYGKGSVTGYALCTDDSAMTIFHVANTQKSTESNYEFSPVEWRIDYKPELFDATYELIEERLDKQYDDEYEDKFEEIVRETYDSFVNALHELKLEGVFSDDVFLTVVSTDPSDNMILNAREANKQLNSKSTLKKWEDSQSQSN